MRAVFGAYEVWNRRVPTPAAQPLAVEALERHPPPAARGRRIKLRYMTQPSTRPPTFIAFCSQPEELPKSYLRYLINSLREAFDLPGVPIRFKLRKGENPFARKRGLAPSSPPPPCGEGSGVGVIALGRPCICHPTPSPSPSSCRRRVFDTTGGKSGRRRVRGRALFTIPPQDLRATVWRRTCFCTLPAAVRG